MRKQTANYGRMTDTGEALMRIWGKAGERGHIKIRPVRCGKKACRMCPHAWYAYHVSFNGEKYLGVCNEKGRPRERYR